MSDSMETLVHDALGCVERECAVAHRGMREALGDLRVHFHVGAEQFAVVLGDASGRPSPRALDVQATAKALHAVLGGERTLLDAIVGDEIVVHGDATDLVAAADAALFFVKGAARCTSMDPMFVRLKRLADEEP